MNRLLELTTHERLKFAWIIQLGREEVKQLLSGKTLREKVDILSMCSTEIKQLLICDEEEFNKNAMTAMEYFGIDAVEKDQEHKITQEQKERIIADNES